MIETQKFIRITDRFYFENFPYWCKGYIFDGTVDGEFVTERFMIDDVPNFRIHALENVQEYMPA